VAVPDDSQRSSQLVDLPRSDGEGATRCVGEGDPIRCQLESHFHFEQVGRLVFRQSPASKRTWDKQIPSAGRGNLPLPGVIAREIVESSWVAREQFKLMAGDLGNEQADLSAVKV
jgi:hypothetical protein